MAFIATYFLQLAFAHTTVPGTTEFFNNDRSACLPTAEILLQSNLIIMNTTEAFSHLDLYPKALIQNPRQDLGVGLIIASMDRRRYHGTNEYSSGLASAYYHATEQILQDYLLETC